MLIERHTLRLLHQQIAVARFDGLKAVERAARRTLKACEAGDITGLDAQALDVLRVMLKEGLICDFARDHWLEVEGNCEPYVVVTAGEVA